MPELDVFFGDNLPILQNLASSSVNLVYIDPPFNTGKIQKRTTLKTRQSDSGVRTGFGQKKYQWVEVGSNFYSDIHQDFLSFLRPRLMECHRILVSDGSLFFHLDYREIHYCKIMLDKIFGRDSFMNEIIWAYDYGARQKTKWPTKHDTILWYAKNPHDYIFNYDEMDRVPYMAPALAGKEKARKGKTPTDVWWHSIVGTNSREKTGYPTQKPLGILNRIIKIHSRPADMLCDFFAGSGSFGEAAIRLGRNCILIDNNPQAIESMKRRFKQFAVTWHNRSEDTANSS